MRRHPECHRAESFTPPNTHAASGTRVPRVSPREPQDAGSTGKARPVLAAGAGCSAGQPQDRGPAWPEAASPRRTGRRVSSTPPTGPRQRPPGPGAVGGLCVLGRRRALGAGRVSCWCRSGGPSQHGLITGAHDGEGERHGAQGRGHMTLRATTRRTERGPDRARSVRHSEADPRPLRPAVRFDSSFCATASSPRGLRGSRGIPGESEGAVNKGASR